MNRNTVRKFLPLILLLIILLFLSTGNNTENKEILKRSRFLMGTMVDITAVNPEDRSATDAAISNAFEEIKRLESLLGRHQEESDIWKINHSGGSPVEVAPETVEVVKDGIEFARSSGSSFDITVGRLVELWNFEGGRKTPPDAAEIGVALDHSGIEKVHIGPGGDTVSVNDGVHLDLGGIAKGYIVDRASSGLIGSGVDNFIINAGGDMIIRGKKGDKPWRIGLQHPRKPEQVLAYLDVEKPETAIVTSGDYERFFIHEEKRYHHILDPATGYPAAGIISVTVTSGDTKTADALSTAVFVMGAEKGLTLLNSLDGVEGIIVDSEENIHLTEGLKGIIVIQ